MLHAPRAPCHEAIPSRCRSSLNELIRPRNLAVHSHKLEEKRSDEGAPKSRRSSSCRDPPAARQRPPLPTPIDPARRPYIYPIPSSSSSFCRSGDAGAGTVLARWRSEALATSHARHTFYLVMLVAQRRGNLYSLNMSAKTAKLRLSWL